MNKIFSTVLVAAACVALSACNDDKGSNDTIIQYPLTNCFAQVYDSQTGTSSYIQGVNYTMNLNVTQATAEVAMTGLSLPNGSSYPSIALSGLKAATDGAWTVIGSERPAVRVDGFSAVPQFTDFSIRLFERIISEAYVPGLAITYSIDSRYRVFSAREGQIVTGKTTSTPPTGEAFVNEEAAIGLSFDTKTMKVTIEMPGSKFLENMPAQNIILPDIPFTMTPAGLVSFGVQSLTPTIGSTPYPNFPITALQGTYDFTRGLNLNFTCNFRGTDFRVEAEAGY